MKAYIVSQFWSGLGDAYSNYVSCYVACLELEAMGYDTYFMWDTSRCQYLPFNSTLEAFFKEDIFKNKVIYNDQEITTNYSLLQQNQKSFKIYVNSFAKELISYESILYTPNE